MKRRGSLLFAIAFVLAAAGFAFAAQRAEIRADGVSQGVTLHLETPLSEDDAQELFDRECLQEDAASFTVWGELAGQRVSDPDLGRYTQADVLVMTGSPQIVLAQANGLLEGDRTGCLIGEETAWKIFGSTGVVGDDINIGRETRTIRGVIHQPKSGVIVAGSLKEITEHAQNEKLCCYDRITLSSGKAADGEAFLMKNALEGEVLRFDYLRNLTWISELIPGKWSDFSGWKQNYKRKQQDFDRILQVHKNSLEVCYEKQCMALMWNRAFEAVCSWAAVVYLFHAGEGGIERCKKLLR